MSAISDRLSIYITSLGQSTGYFAERCGLKPSSIATLNENSNASTFNKIYTAYPQLNPRWLQLGLGDMLRTVTHSVTDYNTAKNDMAGMVGEDDYIIIQQKRIKSIIADLFESRSIVEKQIEHYSVIIDAKDKQIEQLLSMIEARDKEIQKLLGMI